VVSDLAVALDPSSHLRLREVTLSEPWATYRNAWFTRLLPMRVVVARRIGSRPS